MNNNNGENYDDYDDDDYDSNYDDEYDSEFDEDYEDGDDDAPGPEAVILPSGPQAALLATFIQQMPPAHADLEPDHDDDEDGAHNHYRRRAVVQSPVDQWMEYMADIQTGMSKVLKLADEGLDWFFESQQGESNDEGGALNLVPDNPAALFTQIAEAIAGSPGLTHVIWGKRVWQLGSPLQQHSVLQAMARHASTLTYWKMGTDERGLPLGSPAMTGALLETWNSQTGSSPWVLTELELRGIVLASVQQVEMMTRVLRQMGATLKQVNLLGFFLHPTLLNQSSTPVFDNLIATISKSCIPLDEFRLCRCVTRDSFDIPSLISPEALQNLLLQKPKWWRLGLDGLGLDNRHVQVLVNALKSSPTCKMGDLLSLKENPRLTDYGVLVNICSCKARMGLVQVDDPSWVATFDLVRSLNNLHRRLDYALPETGGYPNRSKWVDWLSVVSNLQWEDDAHKVNYLWYTLLEKPDFIRPATMEETI